MFLIVPPVLLRMVIVIKPLLPTGCAGLRPVSRRVTTKLAVVGTPTRSLRIAGGAVGVTPVDVVVMPPAGASSVQPHCRLEAVLVVLV